MTVTASLPLQLIKFKQGSRTWQKKISYYRFLRVFGHKSLRIVKHSNWSDSSYPNGRGPAEIESVDRKFVNVRGEKNSSFSTVRHFEDAGKIYEHQIN